MKKSRKRVTRWRAVCSCGSKIAHKYYNGYVAVLEVDGRRPAKGELDRFRWPKNEYINPTAWYLGSDTGYDTREEAWKVLRDAVYHFYGEDEVSDYDDEVIAYFKECDALLDGKEGDDWYKRYEGPGVYYSLNDFFPVLLKTWNHVDTFPLEVPVSLYIEKFRYHI